MIPEVVMAFRWSIFAAAMFLAGALCAVSAAYLLPRPGAVGRTGLAAGPDEPTEPGVAGKGTFCPGRRT